MPGEREVKLVRYAWGEGGGLSCKVFTHSAAGDVSEEREVGMSLANGRWT